MVIVVDIEKLLKMGIDINQYLFCSFIYQQSQPYLKIYTDSFGQFFDEESLDYLRSLGYLELKEESRGYKFSNLVITDLFVEDFVEKPIPSKLNSNKVEEWIDEWIDLFPKGVKSGGYLVRSDRGSCLNKMKKFIKSYPEYDKEIIMRATKDYVNYYRMKQWNYMQVAHYFISKNEVSNLASNCEDIKHKLETKEIEDLNIDHSIDRFTKRLN